MADGTTIAAGIDLSVNVQSALKGVQALESSVGKLEKSFSDVSKQVDAVISRIESLTSVASKANQTVNNINSQTVKIKAPKTPYSVTGTAGSMGSQTGRGKAFKEYEQSLIDAQKALTEETKTRSELNKELANDKRERAKVRGQEAAAKSTFAGGFALAAAKKQNQNSAEYLAYQKAQTDALNESKKFRAYREKHPELFASGGMAWNWRYQIGNATRNVGSYASQLGTGGRVMGDALNIAGGIIKAPAAGVAAALDVAAKAVMDFSKAAIQAYSEIDSTKTQLGVVFSSQTQADSTFNELAAYATKSPFGVQQTSDLAILLKQSGVYASDLMDTLKMLGDTAGGNMEKMKRIANNYAQIISIGKASMLDMRQFAYAGIPVFEAVSKELGVSQQELRKLISEGKVTSDIVEKVFKDLTGINGLFENATDIGAKTLKARLQNLSDAKQLAMANFGNWGYNLGASTGNDSLVAQLVTGVEGIYQWLQNTMGSWITRQEVSQLEGNEKLVKLYEDLIKDYESAYEGRQMPTEIKEFIELYKRRLNSEKGKFDVEQRRRILVNSYDDKTRDWFNFKNTIKGTSLYTPDDDPTLTQEKLKGLLRLRRAAKTFQYDTGNKSYADMMREIESSVGAKNLALLNDELTSFLHSVENLGAAEAFDILNTRIDELRAGVEAFEKFKTTTTEEELAAAQRFVYNSQSSASDIINKGSGDKDSLHSDFEELYSILRNSDEQKKKDEEEKIKRLKAAQDTLKELVKKASDDGTVDQSKFTAAELMKYLNKKAFTAEKLTAVEDKSTERMAQDRGLLTEQINEALAKINIEALDAHVPELVQSNLRGFYAAFMKNTSIKDDKDFLNATDKLYKKITEYLQYAGDRGQISKNQLKDWNALFQMSTLRLKIAKEGVNANLDELNKGKPGDVHIPLYKRILAEYTGLTTQGMKDTKSTLENYRDDMAIRKMTASVLSATMKSMGLNTAMGLVKTAGTSKVLPYAPGATYQVDWLSTKKAVQEFAMQLSASTEVISAYTSGLEAELDTYEKLVAAGYTQGESQDLKDQKTLSAKQFAKIVARGDQLVNAFGDKLVTAEGQEVEFKNGKFVDSKGNEVAVEELRMTEKLFTFIQAELPRLREEIREANVQKMNNAQLAAMLKSTQGTMLTNGLLSSRSVSPFTAYLAQNPEYMESMFDTNLTALKNSEAYNKKFEGKSNADILIAANRGDKEALELIDDVFRHIEAAASSLVNSEKFRKLDELSRLKQRDNALNSRMLRLEGVNSWDRDSNGIKSPDEYGGRRGRGNWLTKQLGVGKDYDIEDLYVKAARTGAFGIETERADGSKRFTEDMSDDDVLKELTDQEKALISQKELWEDIRDITADMAGKLLDATKEFAEGTFLTPFEYLGESLVDSESAAENLQQNMKNITAGLLKNVGSAMASAGFQIAASAAMEHDWAGVAAGLALAAAGGFASGLGSGLTSKSDKDKDDDKVEKLKNLKNDLADLLKQAREDAIYYETTLRHQKAVSANDSFTTKKVNDAIITPSGDIISTHPDDYLIATKTPKTLLGGGGSPTINFSVIDKSTGIKVTQQKSTYNEDTNSIDFEAVIESKVQEIIATGKGDDAFNAREARLRGRRVIA